MKLPKSPFQRNTGPTCPIRRLRSLAYELFCCGESHSAAAACDDGNLPLKSVQLFLLLAHEFVSQTATPDSSTI
jgi:hypothetical protein